MGKWKFKIIDIIIFLLFFSVVKISVVPQGVQQLFKIVSLTTVLIYVVLKGKACVNIGMILSGAWILSSVLSFATGEIRVRTLLDGILNGICVFCISGLVTVMRKRDMMDRLLARLWLFSGVASVLSLVTVVTSHGDKMGAADIYFFGNKYATCYILLFFMAMTFYHFYNKEKRKLEHPVIYGALIFVAVFTAFYIRCSTALLGSLVMILSYFSHRKKSKGIEKIIETPAMSLVFTLVPSILALNAAYLIANNEVIHHFITVTLGKSAGMTGRTHIYSKLISIAQVHPIMGYGYNSYIVQKVTQVGNSQNGLMELMIAYGIIGVLMFVSICYLAFENSRNVKELWGLKMFFISMCVCSIVEISFNYLFLLATFILLNAKAFRKKNITRK